MQAYQALLRRPENVAHVRTMRHEIERAGGKVEIPPPEASGLVIVTLRLPPQVTPEQFFPGLPFYPA
jgi:hypothetical protein